MNGRMIVKKGFIITVMLLISLFCRGQAKQVQQENQVWTQYSLWGRFSERWSIYFDVVDRFNDFFKSQNTIFLRPGLIFDLSDHSSIYAGYCYAVYFPDGNSPDNLAEHRPWQQFLMNNAIGNFSFQHRYRLEERFNEEPHNGSGHTHYIFTWRLRYKLNVQYAIINWKNKERSLSLQITDELFTSFGKHVTENYFNQNRFFAGFSFQFKKGLSTSFGVTEIFRSTNTTGHFINISAPTININHKLNFRKDNGK